MSPLPQSGDMAVGEHFIGRTNIINHIETDIFTTAQPANMAFIGVNGIGTSSLVHAKIFNRKDDLIIDKSVIPIEISVSINDQSSTFFHSLITQCKNRLEELDTLSPSTQELFDSAINSLQPSDPWNPWDNIAEFFKEVKTKGFYTLLILDRFDKARSFEKNAKAFKYLRDLASQPHSYGVRLVLISRMNIEKIEEIVDSVSELHRLFTYRTHYLGMFSDEDLKAYFTRFSAIGIQIPDEAKERVRFYCGGHPYLLNILGWQIVDNSQNCPSDIQANDVNQAAQVILPNIFSYYESLIRLLEELGTLDKLIQILFFDAKPDGNDGLENYGLIKLTEEETYVAYSEHFYIYLRDNLTNLQERLKEVELPSATLVFSGQMDKLGDIGETTEIVSDNVIGEAKDMWEKTERALREVITNTMYGQYGEKWIEILQTQWPSMFKQAQKRQALGENDPGVQAPQNPIYFTETADLFEIILDDCLWESCFCDIFTGDQDYWKHHQTFLAHRRNSIHHSNGLFLQPDQFKLFQGYCEEILRVLSEGPSASPKLKQRTEAKPVKLQEANLASGKIQSHTDQKALRQAKDKSQKYNGKVTRIDQLNWYITPDDDHIDLINDIYPDCTVPEQGIVLPKKTLPHLNLTVNQRLTFAISKGTNFRGTPRLEVIDAEGQR